MPTSIKDECAIVGIGQTEFSENSGRSELQLTVECVKAAIEDAQSSHKPRRRRRRVARKRDPEVSEEAEGADASDADSEEEAGDAEEVEAETPDHEEEVVAEADPEASEAGEVEEEEVAAEEDEEGEPEEDILAGPDVEVRLHGVKQRGLDRRGRRDDRRQREQLHHRGQHGPNQPRRRAF